MLLLSCSSSHNQSIDLSLSPSLYLKQSDEDRDMRIHSPVLIFFTHIPDNLDVANSLKRLASRSSWTIIRYLADETAILLLYSLVHGNSNFLEYVLVRTDLETLLMPMLETLYNASKGTSNQIYMVLIILLVLSQDSSFNASIHKLMLPSVPWYQERLLHQTSLGSLMIIILIRTVNYNLSKLRVWLGAHVC
ncbi:dymeclin-like [Camellia sinensis]|uniref:dymeclin-like n=1 Tax=Camellia sinensis TaxID=4442 RepID=UPI0010369097|nr:dymeclin-like [Camellia sinensis]